MFNDAVLKSVLRRFGPACLPLAFAFSLAATNAPAPSASPGPSFIDPGIVAENPALRQLNDVMKKTGLQPESLLDQQFLFASLIWGSVGGGYLLYARKQREIVPFIGGVGLILASCLISSGFWMSLVCLALMVGIWRLMKLGW